MSKPMRIMLISLGILFGLIFIYKLVMGFIIKSYISSMSSPTITVSTGKASYATWQPRVSAVGSVRAIKGVNVTTELAGMVEKIYFTPGSYVTEGALLVQLNAGTEVGQLETYKANAELAKITYNRDKAQFAVHAVSQQTLQTDYQNWQGAIGQVIQQAATVQKKSIRAPFTGKLGISAVNPGQYLNAGDKVVNLQMLDPIYVDFYVPQQLIAKLKMDQTVVVTTDTYPNVTFKGKITTIDPAVDTSTRNIEVEATFMNNQNLLVPGMFTNVTVDAGTEEKYLTVPQAAISYNPYGDLVYLVKANKEEKDKEGNEVLTVQQVFVVTGEARGDQVQILKGLNEGDVIVTSGQVKLKNGSKIKINNSIKPSDSANPKITQEE